MATLRQRDQQDDSTSSDLPAETEKALHRLFDAVYSEGDLSVAGRVVATNYRGYCEGTQKTYQGVSGLKAHAARLRATFPGLTVETDEVHRTPEGFEAELTATGRFERAFDGVQPSCRMGAPGEDPGGLDVEVACRAYGTMADGRIVGLAFEWNFEALRAQG